MIGLEDRQALAQDIMQANADGSRLRPACAVAGIDLRTLQRWQAHQGLTVGDGRPQAVRPMPSHALSLQERERLLAVANDTVELKPLDRPVLSATPSETVDDSPLDKAVLFAVP